MIFPFRARRARARVAIPRERARVNFSRDRVWVPANPRGKNTGEARARTVTLVALRAATEPVKEEAMQAIFKVLLCDVKCGCVCRNGVRAESRGVKSRPNADNGQWIPPGKSKNAHLIGSFPTPRPDSIASRVTDSRTDSRRAAYYDIPY